MNPENGHKNDLRDETLPYKEQTERAGAVQPGEEKAPRRPSSIYKEVIRKKGTKSLAGWFKLKEGRYRLDVRKKCFTIRSTSTGCPERL